MIRTMLVVLAVLLAGTAIWAQSGAGTIQGTVQDATSAAIPACSVQAVNQATGVSIETTSNNEGFYAVKGLFAGSYKVSFSSPGMKKSEVTITL
ncbi:MAG: carboxypeptidase-like regulatory domain-containing protein, partial [Bryobacteraceae bacterium]|nr:carboxypeptidase-like regulatory domain-containing protein [Bryobacteraceae bacterium]